MKKNTFFLVSIITLVVAVITIVLIAHFSDKNSDVNWVIPSQGQYETTWKVAADKDYPPYSFVDENGVYAGHDVELIYALGEKLKVNIDLELVSWEDAMAGISDGTYDALLGVTYSDKRAEEMLFSTPTISDPYVLFGYETKNFTLSVLDSAKISTLTGDNVVGMFLTPYGLVENTLFLDTYTECFKALINNQCDYVVAPYTTGRQVLLGLGADSIQAIGPELYNSIFCIAFPLTDDSNRDLVNTALSEMSTDGTMDEIYERWLVKYTNAESFSQILINNWPIAVAIVLLFFLVIIVIYYFMDKHSNRLLYIQTERARIFSETVNDPLIEYRVAADCLEYTYKDEEKVLHTNRFEHYMGNRTYEDYVAPEFLARFETLFQGIGYIDGKAVYEAKAKLAIPEWLWYRATMCTIHDENGKLVSILGRVENINAAVMERDAIKQRATTDSLTGLLNRDTFFGTVYSMLSEWQENSDYAFILLDIDDFKHINDTYGHSTGDEALKFVAEALGRVFEAQDIIGRYGGDEFMVFMADTTREAVMHRLGQLRKFLIYNSNAAFRVLNFSAGVVFSNDNKIAVKSLFEKADASMYIVKHSSKDNFRFSDQVDKEKVK